MLTADPEYQLAITVPEYMRAEVEAGEEDDDDEEKFEPVNDIHLFILTDKRYTIPTMLHPMFRFVIPPAHRDVAKAHLKRAMFTVDLHLDGVGDAVPDPVANQDVIDLEELDDSSFSTGTDAADGDVSSSSQTQQSHSQSSHSRSRAGARQVAFTSNTAFSDIYASILNPSEQPQQQPDDAPLSTDEFINKELEEYFAEVIPSASASASASASSSKRRDRDPALQFWSRVEMKKKFSHLYQLVLKHLAAPTSSVYSERLFSQAGNIYTNKRSRLGPNTSEKLLFLQKNYSKYDV
jgi:hypothetical protein